MSERLLEVLEDFRHISDLVKCAPEPKGVVQPEDVFILFLPRCPNVSDTDQTVEETVNEYLDCLPESKRTPIKIIKCKVSPEELHLVSLGKIYPWSLVEVLRSLPALIRLDGAKSIYGSDITDFNKLDLLFRKFSRVPFSHEPPVSPDTPARYAVVKVEPGDCSQHGKFLRPPPVSVVARDIEYPKAIKQKVNEVQKSLPRSVNLCTRFHLIPVERRPKEEPVTESPPPPIKQKKKKKKKAKGKKGKKKGKGKGKGKKRKK